MGDAANQNSAEQKLAVWNPPLLATLQVPLVVINGNIYDIHHIIQVFDAPLTPAGVKQAEGIRGKAAALDPELIVTSPLIRSVQTCLLAFPHEDFGDKVRGSLNGIRSAIILTC